MKAILVVNVPIEMLNDDTCVTITSLYSGMSFNAKLKPLPDKKAEEYSKVLNYADGDFANGWNACIDEILGE